MNIKTQTNKTVNSNIETNSVSHKCLSWIKKSPVEFYILMTLVPSLLFGLIMAGIEVGLVEMFKDLHVMHTSHINKTIEYFGFGAALFNASAIGLLFYAYGKIVKVKWTASSFMTLMLVWGFSFYVLNFYAMLFILVGIFASSLIFKSTLDKSYGAATLSTCLTPVFALLAFGNNAAIPQYGGIMLGAFLMILTGVMAQKIGGLVAKVNDGLTLANTGVSHGFLAIFFYTIIIMSGAVLSGNTVNDELTDYLGKFNDTVWYLIVYMSVLTTFMLALYWKIFPKENGIIDMIKKDGKAPTDYFVVSGKREAAFNIWAFMHFAILLELIWTFVAKDGIDNFGFNSNTNVAFVQVFGFAAFGHNLISALIMVAGFYVAYYFTFVGPNNVGDPFGSQWNGAWGPDSFMSLIMFGWLLTPMIGVNITAPFVAAIFHSVFHRMMGKFNGGLTYYNHGASTFLSVVLLVPFYQGINWIRKPKGSIMSDLSLEEARSKLERDKAVAMSAELLYYLSDEGATDIGTKYKFAKNSTIIRVEMEHGKKAILENLTNKMNDYKRDPIIEYNLWSTLGTDASSRNLALLSQMTDTAKLEKEGKVYVLTMKRKIKEEALIGKTKK